MAWLSFLSTTFWAVSTGLWIWMLIDCARNERETYWFFIILFFPGIGALIYFLVRYLPRFNLTTLPASFQLKRFTRKQDLWNAQAAVQAIGKDHQYLELGNVYFDMGRFQEAAEAYQTALDKSNRTNTQALWGFAQTQILLKNFSEARETLETLLKIDPDHKFGDASGAYGQVLYELEDLEAARIHLEHHLKRWTSPEGRMIVAEIAIQQGDPETARTQLQTMITNLRGGPQFHYRQHRHLIHKAERMLRMLKTLPSS
jgi:hypothetical protein